MGCRSGVSLELQSARFFLLVAFLTSSMFWFARPGGALPFNDDMVHNQFSTNEVMRPTPKRSVPLGSLERYIASPEEAEALENPIAGDSASVFRGQRLWNVSCSPCHGVYDNGSFHREIPIESGLIYLNFEDPSYWDTESSGYRDLSDGFIFRYIHFGGAIMPRYGWKLTITEHWDIVNYINSIWEEKRQNAR